MAKIRQEINILDAILSAAGGASGTSNEIVQLDTTQYVNPTYYFEVVGDSSISISFNITLRRKGTSTDDATCNIPLLTTAYKRVRSSSFTPPAGQTEYVVFIDATAGATKNVKSARIIIIDNPTNLTSSESQIEIGMNKTGLTSTTATKVVPDSTLTKYWKYTAANWDGTKTFYAEVTYLMASSKSSGTFVLQEDDGSFGSWTDKVTIVNAGVASVATRVRSIAFTPVDGRNYRIAYLVASSKSAATIFNAKIIVQQGFSDNFTATNINLSRWPTSFGTAAVVSSQLKLTVNANSNNYSGIDSSVGAIDLTGKEISVEIISIGTSMPVSYQAFPLQVFADSNNKLKFYVTGTTIVARKTIAGVETDFGSSQTYNAATHKYLRIRELSGTTYMEYSSDRLSWSVLTSGASPITMTSLQVEISAGDFAVNEAANAMIVDNILSTAPTLLEPQYLLLNTTDAGTGLQTYQTLWDSTEWSGVTNTYKHAIDSDNASNSAKLQDIDNANADVTSSTVTGSNQQISSALTMPTTGHQIDVNVTNSTGIVAGSRILVTTSVTAAPTTPVGRNMGVMQNTLGAVIQQAVNRGGTY